MLHASCWCCPGPLGIEVQRVSTDVLLVGPSDGAPFCPGLLEVPEIGQFTEYAEMEQMGAVEHPCLTTGENKFELVRTSI